MKIGFIGLGKMGYNMCLRLQEKGHRLVVNDLNEDAMKKLSRKKGIESASLEEMVSLLPSPRIIWLMVPAGKPVDDLITKLKPTLKRGDIIIDGGNSYFKDSQRRAKQLKKKGIHFLDCGVSGGVDGARNGACMMVGGPKTAYKKTEKLYKDMCVKDGYGYMGSSGGGHFVKMVHNGIEYGMMASIAEGLQAIKKKQKQFGTDIMEATKVYAHGSIIESRLMEWTFEAMQDKKEFDSIKGSVPKGFTEDEMKELEKMADMKMLHEARLMRIRSRSKPSFAGKIMAAMRNQFGGHSVKKK